VTIPPTPGADRLIHVGRRPGVWAVVRRTLAAGALVAALAAVSAGLAGCSRSDGAVATGAPSPATAGGGASTASPPVADDPVRLRIPDIGVSAPVVPLDLDAHGQLEPPRKFTEVGWNYAGPEPGEDGVAVIAGHVDSKTGPAVFYRLGDLRPGAAVFVEEADGHTARFVVDRIARYPKNAFPDAEVYRSGSGAQLRLITCGGAFNRSTGHYVDNIVAFAHLV